ncbi:MAG: hypothetical protein L0241_09860 [Planctomycetia bacterium]|nr:hypothetical protein [Planctomycetia bacterium]
MSRRLAVQHWIASLEATVEPPAGINNFYNLLRVGHTHVLAPDTEFPTVLPRLDMFARFVNGSGVAEFEADVIWMDAPEGWRRTETYWPLRVAFRPGEPLRDTVFRLLGIPLEGVGRYRIDLRAIKPRKRSRLATEYFYVVR